MSDFLIFRGIWIARNVLRLMRWVNSWWRISLNYRRFVPCGFCSINNTAWLPILISHGSSAIMCATMQTLRWPWCAALRMAGDVFRRGRSNSRDGLFLSDPDDLRVFIGEGSTGYCLEFRGIALKACFRKSLRHINSWGRVLVSLYTIPLPWFWAKYPSPALRDLQWRGVDVSMAEHSFYMMKHKSGA